VIFKDVADSRLPSRPIAAPGLASQAFSDLKTLRANISIPFRAFPNQQPYNDVTAHVSEIARLSNCPEKGASPTLPSDCRELADTPEVLFRKLDEWGFDAMVIPHGTTWGFYTPPGYVYDKQLQARYDNPKWQQLIEVFSGHGNSEEYRSFRSVERTEDGLVCPEPSANFEPCCWRAGEIVRSRCDDPLSEDCKARVEAARTNYLRVGVSGAPTASTRASSIDREDRSNISWRGGASRIRRRRGMRRSASSHRATTTPPVRGPATRNSSAGR
jgi:hypothetical protein